jgi:hypothetical protein
MGEREREREMKQAGGTVTTGAGQALAASRPLLRHIDNAVEGMACPHGSGTLEIAGGSAEQECGATRI